MLNTHTHTPTHRGWVVHPQRTFILTSPLEVEGPVSELQVSVSSDILSKNERHSDKHEEVVDRC